MKKYWKVAAFVALAAIPLIILGKKKADEKCMIPESGDESDDPIVVRAFRSDTMAVTVDRILVVCGEVHDLM